MPARVLDVHVKPKTRSMHRFDIEVEGTHNYFVDGVMVHNSPETTTGGKALKFYASVRLDVRRIETLKDGTEAVGNRTRVKVVKNKVAPPFKQAEFDILYGQGISREGGLIDMGVEQGFVRKAGAWYTYDGDQLGQGKENARDLPARTTPTSPTRSRRRSRRSSASGRASTRRPFPRSLSTSDRATPGMPSRTRRPHHPSGRWARRHGATTAGPEADPRTSGTASPTRTTGRARSSSAS